SYLAREGAALIRKAVFVSGRDKVSVNALRNVLRASENPVVKPEEVQLVRDPVLSDRTLSDLDGKCWKQSESGFTSQLSPLCFVLPASNSAALVSLHDNLVTNIVRKGDVFFNVFPKHQEEIEAHNYPEEVRAMLNPRDFRKTLCQCRAIVSSRMHGVVLGLHMGVPTLGAWSKPGSNKTPDLLKEVMLLPDQFICIDGNTTRSSLDAQVETVEIVYSSGNRRAHIHAFLATLFHDFEAQARHVMKLLAPSLALEPHSGNTSNIVKQNLNTVKQKLNSSSISNIMDTLRTKNESNEALGGAISKPTAGKTNAGQEVASRAPDEEAEEQIGQPAKAPAWATGSMAHDLPVGSTLATALQRNSQSPKPLSQRLPRVDNTPSNSDHLSNSDHFAILRNYGVTALLLGYIVALSRRRHVYSSTRNASYAKKEILVMADDTDGADITANTEEPIQRPVSSALSVVAPTSGTTAPNSPLTPQRADPKPGGAPATDFVAWILTAIGFSAYGKSYLRDTRDPLGLLALQGLTGVVVLIGLERCGMLDLKPGHELFTAVRGRARWAPTLRASQALLTNVAVLCGGVAATNALKAMEPVAAAILSYFLLGKRVDRIRFVAIFTIILGIVVLTSKSGWDTEGGGSNVGASMDTSSGNRGGEGLDVFTSALVTFAAVCCNALRNVVLKQEGPTSPYATLFVCSVAASIVGAGLLVSRLLLGDPTIPHHVAELSSSPDSGGSSHWLQLPGINAALCFVGHGFASFNLLAVLSPAGHAVGNSCERILVFASGLVVLGEVMSWRQLVGASVALCGFVGYNTAGLWQEAFLIKS
ncbi:unnamed protein product, partial [Sphacelaria rigidula]